QDCALDLDNIRGEGRTHADAASEDEVGDPDRAAELVRAPDLPGPVDEGEPRSRPEDRERLIRAPGEAMNRYQSVRGHRGVGELEAKGGDARGDGDEEKDSAEHAVGSWQVSRTARVARSSSNDQSWR